MKNILLINPWIHDFAAYDLWLKPWGLLKISSILKKKGFNVYFVDCLDRHHPLIISPIKDFADGTGKFIQEEIEKPACLKNIPRRYKRYGLPVEFFKKILPEEDIDFILISSGMTYWYGGVFEAIKILRERYENASILLGGTYATLCCDHAIQNSGADYVIRNKEISKLSSLLNIECDFSFQNILNETIDYSWYKNPAYAVLRISLGCSFDCSYCAQKALGPALMLKNKERALEEINTLYNKGIRNFAFYDDALLSDTNYIVHYLKEIIRQGMKVNFYTPNGLHAKFVTKELAELMREANFINPILSLEMANDEKSKIWHNKVTKKDLENAVLNLKDAGYKKGEYTVYLMMGIPGTGIQDVEESIDFVYSIGSRISLSEFSFIPGTLISSNYEELYKEPLLHNNSIFPTFSISEWNKIQLVKDNARKLNANLVNISKS